MLYIKYVYQTDTRDIDQKTYILRHSLKKTDNFIFMNI